LAAAVQHILEAHEALLFHTSSRRGYVALTIDKGRTDKGHRVTYALESKSFFEWMAYKLFDQTVLLTEQSFKNVVQRLIGEAKIKGPCHEVYLRTAWHEGKFYLDLGDDTYRAVVVDGKGYKVIDDPPVYFERLPDMLALPVPVPGGRLDELASILNIGKGANEKLVYGWLLAALGDYQTYPLLVLHGEQGSAKSTLTQGLRFLIDPNNSPTRALSHNDRDLAVAGLNNRILAFDNISSISAAMSDSLCRLSSGSGFGIRKNYTDSEEMVFKGSRPIILNGIPSDLTSRPDLKERSIVVELPAISRDERLTEAEVWGKLKTARPRLLGSLLAAVSVGIKNLDSTKIKGPRIADAAQWIESCAPALGWEPREWVEAHADMTRGTEAESLANWLVWQALNKVLDKYNVTNVTVGRLLEELNSFRPRGPRTDDFPCSPRKLAEELKRYKPMMERAGVVYENLSHTNKGTKINIYRKR
jgi:hypothetical protein